MIPSHTKKKRRGGEKKDVMSFARKQEEIKKA